MIEQLTGDKTCRKCAKTQPVANFSLRKLAKDGLHSYCKACRRAYSNAKTAACERSDYVPKKRAPRESVTAWLLPRDPRCFMQKRIAFLQYDERKAYTVEPANNLTWRLSA